MKTTFGAFSLMPPENQCKCGRPAVVNRDSVDVGDGDEMCDGKPVAREASHSFFVRFVRCSLTTPNPMNSAHLVDQ
jgi:hypothetical protein